MNKIKMRSKISMKLNEMEYIAMEWQLNDDGNDGDDGDDDDMCNNNKQYWNFLDIWKGRSIESQS